MNPRYAAFLCKFGSGEPFEYINWITEMELEFRRVKNLTPEQPLNQDAFTEFIEECAYADK